MRFPMLDQVALPVVFNSFIPGQPHADGRRYLPLLLLTLQNGVELMVVDRHHYVDPALAGRSGIARLVFLLSTIHLQPGQERRQGVSTGGQAGMMSVPEAFGQVIAVPSWEAQSGKLPYESLYTELLVDVGGGTVGVRTSVTADDLAATIGKPQLEVGDWIHVERSRVDILGFEAATPASVVGPNR